MAGNRSIQNSGGAAPAMWGAVVAGMLAIRQSVVRISPAIEPAFCSARRVTLAGSITPICSRSPYSRVAAL